VLHVECEFSVVVVDYHRLLHYTLHCMYVLYLLYLQPQTTNHKNPSRFAKYDPSLGCGNQHPQSTTLTFHKYQKTAKSRSSRGHTQAPKPKSKPPQPTHGQASTPLHNRHLLTLLNSPLKLLQLKPLSYNNLHLPPEHQLTHLHRSYAPTTTATTTIYQFTIASPPRYPIDDVPRQSLIWAFASIHFNRPTRHNTSPIPA
jgi:hypothetical protein